MKALFPVHWNRKIGHGKAARQSWIIAERANAATLAYETAMILIGQYDSPFVRRVAVTLRLYGLAYEHRPWSVWGDAEKIAEFNPLRRVPVLLLEDGTALTECFAILDNLDDQVGAERALLPRSGPARREGLRLVALCSGLADKAVSLLYEGILRKEPLGTWQNRCTRQILDTLALLERDRTKRGTRNFLGAELSHADVAFTCVFRFAREAHPTLIELARFPALSAHAARCEEQEAFRAVYQPITNSL
jgi:glutathione S-transferase